VQTRGTLYQLEFVVQLYSGDVAGFFPVGYVHTFELSQNKSLFIEWIRRVFEPDLLKTQS